jgi:hypothetical protein
MKYRSQFKIWIRKSTTCMRNSTGRDSGGGDGMENLEMKISINQIKNWMESITNRLDQVEERLSGIEDKVE